MDPRHQVNPYIAGSPVTGTEMFYGRQDVFAFVQRNLIGRHRDTPVVLYGQRRTGKTSVLYQLHRHLEPTLTGAFHRPAWPQPQQYGKLPFGDGQRHQPRHCGVTISSAWTFRTERSFSPIRHRVRSHVPGAVWPALGRGPSGADDGRGGPARRGGRAGRLEREVFDYLRHLMQHHPRLNFIFSLGSGLEELARITPSCSAWRYTTGSLSSNRRGPRTHHPARGRSTIRWRRGSREDPADHLGPSVLHPTGLPLRVRPVVAFSQSR